MYEHDWGNGGAVLAESIEIGGDSQGPEVFDPQTGAYQSDICYSESLNMVDVRTQIKLLTASGPQNP